MTRILNYAKRTNVHGLKNRQCKRIDRFISSENRYKLKIDKQQYIATSDNNRSPFSQSRSKMQTQTAALDKTINYGHRKTVYIIWPPPFKTFTYIDVSTAPCCLDIQDQVCKFACVIQTFQFIKLWILSPDIYRTFQDTKALYSSMRMTQTSSLNCLFTHIKETTQTCIEWRLHVVCTLSYQQQICSIVSHKICISKGFSFRLNSKYSAKFCLHGTNKTKKSNKLLASLQTSCIFRARNQNHII